MMWAKQRKKVEDLECPDNDGIFDEQLLLYALRREIPRSTEGDSSYREGESGEGTMRNAILYRNEGRLEEFGAFIGVMALMANVSVAVDDH